MNKKQADAVRESLDHIWEALLYLSEELLTVKQMDKFVEHLKRDKKKEAEEKAKNLDDSDLSVDWPSKTDSRGGASDD